MNIQCISKKKRKNVGTGINIFTEHSRNLEQKAKRWYLVHFRKMQENAATGARGNFPQKKYFNNLTYLAKFRANRKTQICSAI
jgi:hypothetical protein